MQELYAIYAVNSRSNKRPVLAACSVNIRTRPFPDWSFVWTAGADPVSRWAPDLLATSSQNSSSETPCRAIVEFIQIAFGVGRFFPIVCLHFQSRR
jgi:hypothetical protein